VRQLSTYNGMVAIELTNASDGYLARYSIGVKDKYGLRMVGGFFVDVVTLRRATAVVHVPLDGYSDMLTRDFCAIRHG